MESLQSETASNGNEMINLLVNKTLNEEKPQYELQQTADQEWIDEDYSLLTNGN